MVRRRSAKPLFSGSNPDAASSFLHSCTELGEGQREGVVVPTGDSASYSAFQNAEESKSVHFGAAGSGFASTEDDSRNPKSHDLVETSSTGCKDTDLRRRDAGVAERGGFENH